MVELGVDGSVRWCAGKVPFDCVRLRYVMAKLGLGQVV